MTMTDGKVFVGKVSAFFPELGWLAITDVEAPERVFLRDMYSALTFNETSRGVVEKVDVKERAYQLGWNGL